MSDLVQNHYRYNINACAVPTLLGAKRAAASNENVWELPSGKYIAVAPGIMLPPGSILASRQVAPHTWRNVSEDA